MKVKVLKKLARSIRKGDRHQLEFKVQSLKPFFDEALYGSQFEKPPFSPGAGLKHYLLDGFKQGKRPNQWLDSDFYLKNYPDVAQSGMSPLEHYIRFGFDEMRAPSRNLSAELVHHEGLEKLKVNQPREKGEEKSAQQYHEEARLIRESGLFDEEWFLQCNPDLQGQDSILHYCIFGFLEGRDPNPYFRTTWYRNTYADVKDNPLVHYLKEGWRRHYNPSYEFDSKKYLAKYLPGEKDTDPLGYHLKEGREKGNQIFRVDYGRSDCALIIKSGLFDSEWFDLKYPDLRGQDGLLHYCIFGYKEGRLPNPFFDTAWYASQYLQGKNENPLTHYIKYGSDLNHDPSPKFSSQRYSEAYPEVKNSNLNPLSHYLTIGRQKNYKRFDCTHQSQFPIAKNASIADCIAKDIKRLFSFQERELAPVSNYFDSKSLKISFVIPDFGVGGGGHMNIFRMIRLLEMSGHEVEIWIFNPKNHKTADEAYEDIVRHYYLIASKVHLLDEGFHENAVGDVIFATSWDTVWPVQSTVNFKRRMYFVQDFEPLFSPTGTKSELARLTYTKDLDCICASRWLDQIMREQFGRWSNYFNLAADYSLFYPKQKTKNDVPKIVLYARYFTERRAVELALIALEMLADEGEVFHVDMYGANFPVKKTPYSCNIYDKQTPEQLAELYREADVGIVFSLTNYSLVPQEMMACGLPIIEFDTESTRAIYPNDAVVFAGPHPEDIKEKLKSLLHNPERRVAQSEAALNWVKQFSWPGAANRVEQSIIERLSELGYRDTTDSDSASSKDVIKASIIIPTCNGGEIFKKVLKKVLAQRAPWEYEVIVLDSESTDGTVEVIQSHQDVIYKKIKRVNFNHGGTRNYGVSIAKGEFVAFLTQDALPTSEFWLYDLVTMLERFPNAAGVFGKHVAHDDATFFTRKELEEHFGRFATLPLVLSSDRKRPENIGVEEWKNLLHFYSDNNSCLRKSIWKKLPYPEVQYGEDQLWADAIIKAGFTKLYCPTAVVKHSHDYEPEDVYERAKIDADFFKYHWGYKLVSADGLSGVIKSINESETLLGLEMGLSDLEIKERNKVVEMKFKGYCDGVQKKVSLFSESSSEKSRF